MQEKVIGRSEVDERVCAKVYFEEKVEPRLDCSGRGAEGSVQEIVVIGTPEVAERVFLEEKFAARGSGCRSAGNP